MRIHGRPDGDFHVRITLAASDGYPITGSYRKDVKNTSESTAGFFSLPGSGHNLDGCSVFRMCLPFDRIHSLEALRHL